MKRIGIITSGQNLEFLIRLSLALKQNALDSVEIVDAESFTNRKAALTTTLMTKHLNSDYEDAFLTSQNRYQHGISMLTAQNKECAVRADFTDVLAQLQKKICSLVDEEIYEATFGSPRFAKLNADNVDEIMELFKLLDFYLQSIGVQRFELCIERLEFESVWHSITDMMIRRFNEQHAHLQLFRAEDKKYLIQLSEVRRQKILNRAINANVLHELHFAYYPEHAQTIELNCFAKSLLDEIGSYVKRVYIEPASHIKPEQHDKAIEECILLLDQLDNWARTGELT